MIEIGLFTKAYNNTRLKLKLKRGPKFEILSQVSYFRGAYQSELNGWKKL
jgi:hypothetical protein